MGFLENLEARGESVESLTAAREARRALAEYWLELSDGEAEREFSGEMGRIHLQMAVAGVRAGMVSGADERGAKRFWKRRGICRARGRCWRRC